MTEDNENTYIDQNSAVMRLTRDLAKGAATMSEDEARYLVDYYYICQDDRIRFKAQERALTASEEPNMVIGYLGEQTSLLEQQIKRALDKYTDDHPIGKWIKSLYGFGPVLAAGFLAHIDITKAPTAGHIWSYAGLIEGQKLVKGEKRCWNAELKKLVWKAGEVMVKFSNVEECVYGQLFRMRRDYEWNRNLAGGCRDQALRDATVYGSGTEAWKWTNGCYRAADIEKRYRAGMSLAAAEIKSLLLPAGQGDPMLPPSQMHGRARRYAMKIFLSHLHAVWYETHFKERVPKPFAIAHLQHAHMYEVPNYVSPYAGQLPSEVRRLPPKH